MTLSADSFALSGVNTMIVQLARMVLLTAGALGGFAVARLADWSAQTGLTQEIVILTLIILGASMGYLLGGILGREITAQYHRIEQQVQESETTDLVLGAIGLIFGLIAAFLMSYPLRLISPSWVAFLAVVLVYGIFAFGFTRLFLTKRRDVARRFGGLVGESRVSDKEAVKFLDTSAVIDGRFVHVKETGFLEGRLAVPRFVLVELQTLADSADEIKRARGRRGLDLLTTLTGGPGAISIFEADYPEIPAVDAKLVRLAASSGGVVVTVDHNLSQVARVEGVAVLNVNELAASIRPLFLPGDSLRLLVAREGKEAGQGVGYLEDGTMVVIAEAKERVGVEADVEVTSVLQTSAGRMIFARVKA